MTKEKALAKVGKSLELVFGEIEKKYCGNRFCKECSEEQNRLCCALIMDSMVGTLVDDGTDKLETTAP